MADWRFVADPGFYCHGCASELGLLQYVFTSEVWQSQYQFDKWQKHTKYSTSYRINSVFASTSTEDYADYIAKGGSSGAVQVDRDGRRSLIVLADKPTGVTYKRGEFHLIADAVRVVLSSASHEVHAFPFKMDDRETQKCNRCGIELST